MTGGSFVQLTDGVTHYELSNITKDHTVVLVHGFSVPYFIFDPTFHFLTRCGFRVLRYDLFGRGFSDRPDVNYNIDLFVEQLAELLDALRLTRPVTLIGLSMGGPISTTFTARYPERVNKLVLIDPAGGRTRKASADLDGSAGPPLRRHRTERPGSTKPDRDAIVNAITMLAPDRKTVASKWADGMPLSVRPNDFSPPTAQAARTPRRVQRVLAIMITEAVIMPPTKNITAKMPVQKPHSLNMLSISASLLNIKQCKDLLFIIMDSNLKSKLLSSVHCDK